MTVFQILVRYNSYVAAFQLFWNFLIIPLVDFIGRNKMEVSCNPTVFRNEDKVRMKSVAKHQLKMKHNRKDLNQNLIITLYLTIFMLRQNIPADT